MEPKSLDWIFLFCGRNFKTVHKTVCHWQEIAFKGTAKFKFLLKKTANTLKSGSDNLTIWEMAAQHYNIS